MKLEEIARKLTREGLPKQKQFSNGEIVWIENAVRVNRGSTIVYATQVEIIGYKPSYKSL